MEHMLKVVYKDEERSVAANAVQPSGLVYLLGSCVSMQKARSQIRRYRARRQSTRIGLDRLPWRRRIDYTVGSQRTSSNFYEKLTGDILSIERRLGWVN
jgi:hypothetical protein